MHQLSSLVDVDVHVDFELNVLICLEWAAEIPSIDFGILYNEV